MKQRIALFIRTYGAFFLADVLLIVGFAVTSVLFWGVVLSSSDILSFTVRDVYLLFGFPLFAAVHGIIAGIFAKKFWTPHLLLFVVVWFGLPLAEGNFRWNDIVSLQAVVWPVILFVVSIGFAGAAKFARYMWVEIRAAYSEEEGNK